MKMNFDIGSSHYDASKIETIIFDFGNVLLDIDIEGCYSRMSAICGYDISIEKAPKSLVTAMLEFEKGNITLETFLWNFQKDSPNHNLQGIDIIQAWNSMLIGWQPGRLEMLSELKKRYKVYLLSNTNELHLQWVYRDLRNNHNITDFDRRFFNQTFFSHIVGMRKPDQEIYWHVQNATGLKPENTIFIDDIPKNLEAPANLGWYVYHHNPKDDIRSIIKNTLGLM
jgi:putative hydrolase of the HAD superfamily